MSTAATPRAALQTRQIPRSWNEDQKTARIVVSSEGLKQDGFNWAHGADSIRPPAAPVPLLIDQGMGHTGDVGEPLARFPTSQSRTLTVCRRCLAMSP